MVSLKEMARADAARVTPEWLLHMLEVEARFFEPCPVHPGATRCGCNLFCTRCAGRPICSACVGDHSGHHIIQIRKWSHHAVVRVADVEALLDVSDVQAYVMNGEKAVFLNKRPMAEQGKGGEFRCRECDRALLDAAFRFCSLGCKLEVMELDFSVSFTVQPKSDSESREDPEPEGDSSRPTKRSRSAQTGRGNQAGDEGSGTSSAAKLQAAPAAEPSSGQRT